jgi:tetratricopeptide (TPR) repeat protein
MSDYFDLGTYSRDVTTSSAHARLWFNRGLVWAYAFNHEEAVACFERAIEADPGCALAHWGLAYALGPNYNKPWEAFDQSDLSASVSRAFTASRAAVTAAAGQAGPAAATTPVERALAHAVTTRYPHAAPAPEAELANENGAAWNAAYANAMRSVYKSFPADLDVAALFADALMNLTPWALWDTKTGEPAEGSATLEAKAVLDSALASEQGQHHPGILHLYIHLMEMSSRPEDALQAAELLRDLVPDAGHLRHMPTHLDVLCGDYRRVVSGNTAAIEADDKFARSRGAMNFYTLYRAHNHHFKIYGAMFLGQQRTALDAADQLAAAIPAELLRVQVPPMADWLEGFVPMKVHALIRFGRWQDIIDTPLPADPGLYCVTTAMTHYAKGIAHAATGRRADAREQRRLFAAAAERVPPSRTVFNNTCQDILRVAGAMLDGEIDYREGSYRAAFGHLRRAVELDDGLPYDEPWGWMQPARHALGALLLEQGHVEEAEAVYRADLGLDDTLARACQHPANVWSLHGYHECLTRLGKHEQAGIIAQQLKIAAAHADVPIASSCYCRLTPVGQPAAD